MSNQAYANAIVIALGSNHDAKAAFTCAIKSLQEFGQMMLSEVICGKDFTGRSQRIYHNACAYIILTKTMQYTDIEQMLKQIERRCGRNPAKKCAKYDYEVVIDLDILAARFDERWQMNLARLPLKNHDIQGIKQVATFLLDQI